ncbi:MAG: tRNA pseudouridine(55) synthase TruB [Acholeplasmatales bacterium]|nr:tRNA pseudouridine(55) synthase TruB [Acholeplasmatales bacterium]
MIDGIIVLNKPKGMTSFDCISILRKKLGIKKIGHTGTLDKEVDGVLVVCVGKATKLVDILVDHEKTYDCVMKLGLKTKTDDIYGDIVEEKDPGIHSNEEIDKVLNSFLGEYNQIPPMYSSIKINGKKLYQYAVKDIEIERSARLINIYSIKRTSDILNNEFSFTVNSSKGLYVRTLCSDIAERLNELGTMKSLKRVRLGDYSIDEAIDLDLVDESNIIPLERVIERFPSVEVKDYLVPLIKNGIILDNRQTNTKEVFRVINNNKTLALYKPVEDNKYKPVIIL